MVCRLRGCRPAARESLGPTDGPALAPTDLDARLDAIIAPIVAAMGFDLVRIQLSGQPGSLTLQVMAEDPATGQMTLDQCAALSRALDEPLDAADPIASD